MNWNGNRRWVDHMIRILSEPDRAAALQSDLDAYRRNRISDALLTRPVFIPLAYTLPLAGQVTPVRDVTPVQNYDVVITGFKTDCWIGEGRDIIFKFTENEQGLVRVGDETALYLRSDDLMGCSVDAGGGQVGTFQLPSPIMLRAGTTLAVEILKTDVTAADEIVNIVISGFRVLPRAYAETALTAREKAIIDQYISFRPVPQVRFLKAQVTYSAATVGVTDLNVATPRCEEPLLIRGIRTTLRQSMVQMGLETESLWTVDSTPIWGVAAENDLGNDNYIWFPKPVYLQTNSRVKMPQFTNSIDGSNVDDTSNQVTFICETV